MHPFAYSSRPSASTALLMGPAPGYPAAKDGTPAFPSRGRMRPMLNLAIVLEDSVRQAPDRTAAVFGDMRLPYSMVNTLANQVANLLASRGIGRGDKVALACPNLPYFPFVYYGILKAGATVVPLNVLFQANEIAYHLEDSDSKAFFCFEGTPELPLGQRGREGFEQVA